MCGITGYIGKQDSLQASFSALRKLEYRGYDSAGMAYFNIDNVLTVIKRPGKLDVLEHELWGKKSKINTVAIGHSRWATHGAPTEVNAHPHLDCDGQIAVVHNGIIENYRELKLKLEKLGHKFKSETDTEVLPHLIEENLKSIKNFEKAFVASLSQVRGAYALAIINALEPDVIYFARLGSPLVLGLGKNEYFLASDATALAGRVKKVVYIDEGISGKIDLNGFKLSSKRSKIENLELDSQDVNKGNFPHFMLKEIFDGGEVVRAAMRGRVVLKEGRIKLGGLESVRESLKKIKQLVILACGTSFYAGLVGKYLFEEVAGLSVETAFASEYRYAENVIEANMAGIFISQSGETADTLAALRKLNSHSCLTLGIVNTPGSTIARETFAGVYNRAGAEIGVASTKAFLSQLTVLTLMALYFAGDGASSRKIMKELSVIPKKIEDIFKQDSAIKVLAKKYLRYKNFLYLGRGYNYPVALEGALKLKEISYVHAEGFAGGEMKHGPIALIDKNFPTIAIVTKNSLYEKMISNLHEIKARGGKIIAIATKGDKDIKKIVDDVIYVPATENVLEPMLTVVPLQFFAYHFAVLRGCNVDKPRNLAKSVTVE